ncbi:glyoxalase/bleomycin resistance protein/dioxygenase superfamily protein [Cytobacillus oceanisediminis]|uniref:Glyoxalase/bleomycin resistance protein/dioxygenase superfamily protein n=1 Tax=Cytobacillus oceanisediminis TaxID=665099 RepID=A0A2V2ZXU2_9BACI|nr:VOC family protein [Cytobacillus oceanisediminis]PWW28809.1 glyoxalase/bleomycin resistance protein/dioxygenase superfamily protein [Cytobacillus oceanisediminis]
MSGMFKRIDTVFLQVKDFEKAIDWYSTVLGFPVRWKDDQGGYAALEIGETPLTLVRSTERIKERKDSHISFNFFVVDIEIAHRHLLQHRVKAEPLQDDRTAKWFEFEDLDGNKLGVCHFSE